MTSSRRRLFSLAFLLTSLAFSPLRASEYSGNVVSHPILKTTTTIAGQPIEYPSDGQPEVTSLIIDFAPGQETGWHYHPLPLFGYVLQGTLTIHFKDGKTRVFHQGDAFVEARNMLHNGRNEGTEPVKLAVFIMGEKNQPFTVKAKE